MAASEGSTGPNREVDPERVGLVWMDAVQAFIVRWRDEPVLERIDSGVPPRRSAVGSVRRGPARPFGGGRVPGHGTEGRHLEQVDRYLGDLARKLADLHVVEVAGRGLLHQQLATLLSDLARPAGEEIVVTTTTTSRRPSERQLIARLRKMIDRDLPRRSPGRYRRGVQGPTTATGRPMPSARGRRTLRPPHLPEQREIAREVEMLTDDGLDHGPSPKSQDRVRTPPRERFVGREHLFDLTAESERLRNEPGGMRDGHRQITLFRDGGVSIVLFDFEPGGWLRDHAADGYVTVQVLSGEISMSTAEGQHRVMAGALLVMKPGIRHDVQAKTASRMLLTVRLDPARDDRP